MNNWQCRHCKTKHKIKRRKCKKCNASNSWIYVKDEDLNQEISSDVTTDVDSTLDADITANADATGTLTQTLLLMLQRMSIILQIQMLR